MNKLYRFTFTLLPLIATFMMGCGQPQEEVADGSPTPKRQIEFKGKVEENLIGSWKNTKSDVTYAFEKSGTFTYKGTIYTPGGAQKIDRHGEWLVDGNMLKVKDSGGDLGEYEMSLNGKKMHLLAPGKMKLSYDYNKVK